jgi:23S rRNA pseudouridine1911/1915/1917 synthase
MAALDILLLDNHCLAVNKPAGIAAAHSPAGAPALDREVRAYLKERYHKPGNVFLGIVHRLDRPVSGVLLFARTSKAAARLSMQFRTGAVEKTYIAVAEGHFSEQEYVLRHWLRKNEKDRRIEASDEPRPGAKDAELSLAAVATANRQTLLVLRPRTGRKHQIRAQLSATGHAVIGDRRYGSRAAFGQAIALHAWRLVFHHPVSRQKIELEAPLPQVWQERFADLLVGWRQ